MIHKKTEAWLHSGKGWKKQGIRYKEQYHEENRMRSWMEGGKICFFHERTGKSFMGMKSEVCAEVDEYMHNKGYYK